MRAMVLEKFGPIEEKPLRLKELPEPHPAAGQVRLRVEVCAVCRTDLHVIEAELPPAKLPGIPGHQIVGRVDALGAGASRFKVGDRLGIAWLHHTCGKCRFCRRGNENLCPDALFTGYHVDGGYAEYATAPEEFAYRIPGGIPPEHAAPLLCAGIIGYRALKLSGVKRADRLGLYGFGASAHLTLQAARHMGCEVYVFSRSPRHRELAEKLGAVWTGDARGEPPGKLDAAIVFAPAGWLVPEAMRVLERGGACALAGIHMTPIPAFDLEKHLSGERVLRSVTASTRTDGNELLKLAGEIPLRPETRLFPLERANEALLALKQGNITGVGVLQIAR